MCLHERRLRPRFVTGDCTHSGRFVNYSYLEVFLAGMRAVSVARGRSEVFVSLKTKKICWGSPLNFVVEKKIEACFLVGGGSEG